MVRSLIGAGAFLGVLEGGVAGAMHSPDEGEVSPMSAPSRSRARSTNYYYYLILAMTRNDTGGISLITTTIGDITLGLRSS